MVSTHLKKYARQYLVNLDPFPKDRGEKIYSKPPPRNWSKIDAICLEPKLLNGILASVKFRSNDSDSSEHGEAAVVDLTLLSCWSQSEEAVKLLGGFNPIEKY